MAQGKTETYWVIRNTASGQWWSNGNRWWTSSFQDVKLYATHYEAREQARNLTETPTELNKVTITVWDY